MSMHVITAFLSEESIAQATMWLVCYAHVPVSMCIAIASFDSSLREGYQQCSKDLIQRIVVLFVLKPKQISEFLLQT